MTEVFIVSAREPGKDWEIISVNSTAKGADAVFSDASSEGSKYSEVKIDVWGVGE